ncbi:unnamed protein product [Lathyrus oleraceus]
MSASLLLGLCSSFLDSIAFGLHAFAVLVLVSRGLQLVAFVPLALVICVLYLHFDSNFLHFHFMQVSLALCSLWYLRLEVCCCSSWFVAFCAAVAAFHVAAGLWLWKHGLG